LQFLFVEAKKLLNTCKSSKKTLLLSIGPQNFSDFNEKKLQIPKYAKALYKDYYPLLLENPSFFDKTIIKTMCLYPHKKHQAWLGHFEARPYRLSIANLDKTIKRHYYAESDTLCHISQTAIQALDSLILLAQKKDSRLVLFVAPVHPQYQQAIPEPFKKQFRKTLAYCREKGIRILDYSQLSLPDSLFYDYDHLNEKGARIFTQKLTEDLKKGPN